MKCRHVACMAAFAWAIVGLAASAVLEAGQDRTARASSTTGTGTRTAWGDPDLQGVWKTSGATPLERPDAYAGRERLTDEELNALRRQDRDREEGPPRAGDPGTYNRFWSDAGAPTNQTSLLVDPPTASSRPSRRTDFTPANRGPGAPTIPRTGTCGSVASRAAACRTRCCRGRATTTRRSCRHPGTL